MKYKLISSFLLLLVLFSCKNEEEKRLAENKKEAKKKEVIFSNISKGWVFYDTPINTASEASLASWTEWRLFLKELAQKPKKTIGAFQQKAKALSKKAKALNDNIPYNIRKPQIQSRVNALISKVGLLDLFIHLDKIPDDKVILLIAEINKELVSLQRQMDKIEVKAKIPQEEGESDLLQMLDTTRAIPSTPIDKNVPRVE
jgi:hypothetical protein